MWTQSFSDSAKDNQQLLENVLKLIDQSPLGSGAGYDIPINIDKNYTAEKLHFSKVQQNPIYCQHSRSKFDAGAGLRPGIDCHADSLGSVFGFLAGPLCTGLCPQWPDARGQPGGVSLPVSVFQYRAGLAPASAGDPCVSGLFASGA